MNKQFENLKNIVLKNVSNYVYINKSYEFGLNT